MSDTTFRKLLRPLPRRRTGRTLGFGKHAYLSVTGAMLFHLLDANGNTIVSGTKGLLGGNRRLKIYGRLDCPSVLRALPRGYARHRVFFADEATAIAAGYRPCGVYMREEYRRRNPRANGADDGLVGPRWTPCRPTRRLLR